MEYFAEQLTLRALYHHPEKSLAWEYLNGFSYPWEALDGLKQLILALGATLPPETYEEVSAGVWIAKSAVIATTASISAPAIIGEDTELRQGAFIRGSVLIGQGCVVGNSVELKNCILFDGVQVPHYNYVGDSILGYRSHMGAGAITSNVKSDKSPISVRVGSDALPTGRKKFGALLGDYVEVGCNSVLNPGTVIGSHSNVYPLSSVRGYVPPNSIYKARDAVIEKR